VTDISREDAEHLLSQAEFRRFLFAAIQSAGLLSHEGPAHGPTQRDLSFAEGRRSLGFEILLMIERGQPEALRTGGALATINAAIREAMNPTPKEKTHGNRNKHRDTDRYARELDE
jgi:hypothetical protein